MSDVRLQASPLPRTVAVGSLVREHERTEQVGHKLEAKHFNFFYGRFQALNDIYPNFDRDLAAAGAVAVNVPADVRYETPGFSERPQRDFGIAMLSASRPLIESVLRRRTLAAGNVALWSNCRVTEIQQRGSSAAAIVQTVQFNIGAESARTLKADLVIDATGRGALALGFLRTLGWEQPPETRIGVDISYATAVTPIPANLALAPTGEPKTQKRSRRRLTIARPKAAAPSPWSRAPMSARPSF